MAETFVGEVANNHKEDITLVIYLTEEIGETDGVDYAVNPNSATCSQVFQVLSTPIEGQSTTAEVSKLAVRLKRVDAFSLAKTNAKEKVFVNSQDQNSMNCTSLHVATEKAVAERGSKDFLLNEQKPTAEDFAEIADHAS